MPHLSAGLFAAALAAFALAAAGSSASANWFGLTCPPAGYDGNLDCGYDYGGGTGCGNPNYYGSYSLGVWTPDPRCAIPAKAAHRKPKPKHKAVHEAPL
jgi:hypothetical protein